MTIVFCDESCKHNPPFTMGKLRAVCDLGTVSLDSEGHCQDKEDREVEGTAERILERRGNNGNTD